MLIVVAVVGNIEEASAQRSMLCVIVATREGISNPVVRPTTPVGDQEDNSINTAFINTLGEEDSILWFVNLTLGNKEVSFKIDTGAEVTAVSEKVWKQNKRPRLQVPLKSLYGPAHEPYLLQGSLLVSLPIKVPQ